MVRMLAVTLSLVAVFTIPAAAVAQHHPQSHYPNPGGPVHTGLRPPQGEHHPNHPLIIIQGPNGPNRPPRH